MPRGGRVKTVSRTACLMNMNTRSGHLPPSVPAPFALQVPPAAAQLRTQALRPGTGGGPHCAATMRLRFALTLAFFAVICAGAQASAVAVGRGGPREELGASSCPAARRPPAHGPDASCPPAFLAATHLGLNWPCSHALPLLSDPPFAAERRRLQQPMTPRLRRPLGRWSLPPWRARCRGSAWASAGSAQTRSECPRVTPAAA